VSAALAARSLEQLLEDVAAATPAPGGGSAAAWTCALAASLVEMAAAFAIGRDDLADRHARMAEIVSRARSLRAAALQLGEKELHSYEPVLAALQLRRDDPARTTRLEAALSDAADAPLEIARAAAELAELALEAADTGTAHLRGDALTGALLAGAACEAAAQLVTINLARHPGDPRVSETADLTQRAEQSRSAVR
jgi:formiminotetrahydrofolate cyclodeaminase